jgi:hypothetical protein
MFFKQIIIKFNKLIQNIVSIILLFLIAYAVFNMVNKILSRLM